MKNLLSLGCWLLLTVAALAQGLGIPTEIKPIDGYAGIKPKTEAKSITYISMSGLNPLPSDYLADPRWFLAAVPNGTPEGRYRFIAVGAFLDETGKVVTQEKQEFFVVVGDSPVVIVPPGPGPKPPVPPTPPTPVPPPTPIPGDGLKVMIVYEDEDRGKYPQWNALAGKQVVGYLETKCSKTADGKPDWWFMDDDLTEDQIKQELPTNWQQPYRDTVALFHQYNVPMIAISNRGNSKLNPPGEISKAPITLTEIMALLKKYGDN